LPLDVTLSLSTIIQKSASAGMPISVRSSAIADTAG
jgi:hypothetical protein